MNISEMKAGVRYIVTKGSENGELAVGDRIRGGLGGPIKNLSTRSSFKYINTKAVCGVEVQIDPEWAASRRREAMNILAELELEGL